MELLVSHSPFGRPAIIGRPCKASSYEKPTTKNILKSPNFPSKSSTNRLIFPVVRLYNQSRFSKYLLYSQHKCSSIQASAHQDPQSARSGSVLAKTSRLGSACFQFFRPYALSQVILSSICLSARVLVENPHLFKLSLMFKTFLGLIAIILGNAYGICLNDIFDTDIDRVNKPYLPIASGDLSIKQAWFLAISCLLAGLGCLRLMNANLITISLYCLGLFFYTFYSAPPIRFKRSLLATTVFLPLTTGVIQTGGILYASRASLGLPFRWSPPIVFIAAFHTLFCMVIGILKDLTDVEGDTKHNIETFAAKVGLRNAAFLSTGILLINYVGAITTAICMPQAFKCYLMLPAHSIFVLWLLFRARKLDKESYSKEASASFYQFIWKLLKLEFLLFPFI